MASTTRSGSTSYATLRAQKDAAAQELPGRHALIGDIIETLLRDIAEKVLSPSHDPNNLPKNGHYTAGEHQYDYYTDGEGRIEHVHAPQLKLKRHSGRLKNDRNTPDKIKGWDDAGHLIGDQFGGSPRLDNLLSQARSQNQNGPWYKMEREWADTLTPDAEGRAGQINDLDIRVVYADERTKRPHEYHVSYVKIDRKGRKTAYNDLVYDNPKPH